MPNTIRNVIRFTGDTERIKQVLESVKADEHGMGSIDFNKILSPPDDVFKVSGSDGFNAYKIYKEFVELLTLGGANSDIDLLDIPEEKEKLYLKLRQDIKPEELELGRIAYRNEIIYESPTLNNWVLNNWGTSTNAFDMTQIDEDVSDIKEISFNTEMLPAELVINELARRNPDLIITHEWASIELGSCVGRITYENGKQRSHYSPRTLKESFELTMKVYGFESMEEIGHTLNATEDRYVPIWNESYDIVEFQDSVALFSSTRMLDEDVPKGYYCYDINLDKDEAHFESVEKGTASRFGGTLITREKLDFGDFDSISLYGNPIFFNDLEKVSFKQFEDMDFNINQGMQMG